jgi:DNA repair protein SbcC/Rad50
MKILKVEMQNFKPYAKAILPKEAEFGNGLLLIQGNNSMGKTSFMEAILWGILGDKLMTVPKNMLVKTGESSCKVDVIFEIGGTVYRIVRKLVLRKSRKPEPEFRAEAVLTKKEGEKFVPVSSGTKQVDDEVENLIGITAENMEKTIYVRQKDVDRLAKADPKELRELIASLFGLDEFGRIKNKLADHASDLSGLIIDLSKSVGRLETEQSELQKDNKRAKQEREILEKLKDELEKIEKERSRLPEEKLLKSIKKAEEEITKEESEISGLSDRIIDNEKHAEERAQRIASLEEEIRRIESVCKDLEEELKKLPSERSFRGIKEIRDSISHYEESMKKSVTRAKVKLDFDPIENPRMVAQRIKELENSIIPSLEETRKKCKNEVYCLENISTEKMFLIRTKHDSINYIEEHDNCPVCNRDVENGKSLVSLIKKESKVLQDEHDKLVGQISKANNELKKAEEALEDAKKHQTLLDNLVSPADDLKDARNQLSAELEFHSVGSIDELLSKLKFSSVDEAISKRKELETTITIKLDSITAKKEDIKKEHEEEKSEKSVISSLKSELDKYQSILEASKHILQTALKAISVTSTKKLLEKFGYDSIEELLQMHNTFKTRIEEKSKQVSSQQESLNRLLKEMGERKKRIELLKQKEKELAKKQKELRHVKFLKGEIDGFLSIHVIEGKIIDILKNATNEYLMPFSDGRYRIEDIRHTSRRTKGMESHGLEVTLFDEKDNLVKNKAQLSGGDETALGLALRIAISKLMGKIRPFKHSETKPPLVNAILLDEPMGSLDPPRRQELVNVLMQDTNFNQMFLITHTDVNYGDYHTIKVDYDGNAKRTIEYEPMTL